jgi:hypothetical protein
MPSALPSRSVALEPTGLSLSVTSTWRMSARSGASPRPRQLRADVAAVKVQLGLPTPDHDTIRGTFSRRVRSSNAPQTERRRPSYLICFGSCSLEGTECLIATRVHDRLGRARTPSLAILTGMQRARLACPDGSIRSLVAQKNAGKSGIVRMAVWHHKCQRIVAGEARPAGRCPWLADSVWGPRLSACRPG